MVLLTLRMLRCYLPPFFCSAKAAIKISKIVLCPSTRDLYILIKKIFFWSALHYILLHTCSETLIHAAIHTYSFTYADPFDIPLKNNKCLINVCRFIQCHAMVHFIMGLHSKEKRTRREGCRLW